MTGFISKIKTALAAAGAVIALVVAVALTFFRKGKQAQSTSTTIKTLEDERETNKRMNHADVGTDATDNDNAEWLLRRGQGKSERRP